MMIQNLLLKSFLTVEYLLENNTTMEKNKYEMDTHFLLFEQDGVKMEKMERMEVEPLLSTPEITTLTL